MHGDWIIGGPKVIVAPEQDDDEIYGGNGNDQIDAGDGNDSGNGGDGINTVDGGATISLSGCNTIPTGGSPTSQAACEAAGGLWVPSGTFCYFTSDTIDWY